MQRLDLFLPLLMRIIEQNYRAYFIGGCVRNVLFNRDFDDVDITTNAPLDVLLDVFSDFDFDSDHHFLNLNFDYENHPITITPFREEGEYIKHRYPSFVKHTSKIAIDVKRRDFTMNAIYVDHNYHQRDYYQGLQHIKERRLVTIKDAKLAMSEDALRILRALRFQVVYDLQLDESLKDAIKTYSSLIHRLSSGIIDKEFHKLEHQASDDQLTRYYELLRMYNIKL